MMTTIFTIIGYIMFVLFGLGLSAYCAMMFFYGGGDCGPLFGNWYTKGARFHFFIFLAITCVVWYFIVITFPFSISVSM